MAAVKFHLHNFFLNYTYEDKQWCITVPKYEANISFNMIILPKIDKIADWNKNTEDSLLIVMDIYKFFVQV